MKIKYRNFAGALHPILQFSLQHKNATIKLDGLVDSGACECIFSKDIATILGLDLSQAPTKDFTTASGESITGFIHSVKLQIHGFEELIPIDAAFIDANETPLLGQAGLFDNFEVIFRGYRKSFEIKRIKRKKRPHPSTLRKKGFL